MPKTLCLGVCLLLAAPAAAQEWTQDGHDAQRTGYSPEQPLEPWTLRWTWNGPDASGGVGGHQYHQPAPYVPWEARTCTGGSHVYVPANTRGLYALKKSDGTVAWQFNAATCNAAPAYDPLTGSVVVGSDGGTLYRLNAATGAVLGSYAAGGKLSKAALIVGASAYALTEQGVLHKVTLSSMAAAWTYSAGSAAQTLPAYSASRQAVVFCSADLNVHCVNDSNGSLKWKVKPTTLSPGTTVEFTGGWPVVAEQRGVVFVRLMTGDVSAVLWSGGGPSSRWPTTNAAIRQRLVDNPGLKNLFALSLDDGSQPFIPAVGPAGVEDLINGAPRLRVHGFPVIKVVGGKEVAYTQWRNGDTRDPNWDARWDSHLGEMLLDSATVPGYQAGDVRFVQFEEHDNWVRITDESCPLTMAGDSIFHAHWDASEGARITDRSNGLGGTRGNPIKSVKHPPVARHVKAAGTQFNATTHWTTTGMSLFDGRWKGAPGWWVYWNVYDPPTPDRTAYSEGILPRYTYVSDGLVIVEGNGGDLFVLKHSGTALPSPGGGSGGSAPASPSNLAASAASASQINLSWTDASSNETGFRIERKSGAGGSWTPTASPSAGATTYNDTSLAASTSYTYRIRATNATGDSGWSNEATAITPAPAAFVLTVTSGSGDGSYPAGTVVTITANAPAAGQQFSQWTGAAVAVPTALTTTLAMPATNTTVTATYAAAGPALPAPWSDGDIGSPAIAGDASLSGSTLTVCAAGADIWGMSDSFHFASIPLDGDGEIVVRIVSIDNSDPWAKAGVMIRESLAANSTNAFMALTPGNGATFQRRLSAAGATTGTAGPGVAAPYWVRLSRAGDLFTGSVSPDGVNWTIVGLETVPMAASVFIGIAVTSHNPAQLNCADVDSIGGSGGWAGATAVAAGSGGGGGGGCGLTGLEAMALLLLARRLLI